MESFSLLKILEELSMSILDHYREKLRGIVLNLENDKKIVYLLLVLKNTKKISLINRGIIFNYFYNKIKKSETFKQYLNSFKHSPKIYPIILDESELDYHNPFILYILLRGKILFQRENIISQKTSKIRLQIINYKGEDLLDFGKIRKGEIREV